MAVIVINVLWMGYSTDWDKSEFVTEAEPHPTMARVWAATVRDAGWRGLWRGATARAVSNAPSGAIMFAVYEAGHRWLQAKMDGRGSTG